MKTIGLIGGLSWYSTSEYYRVINEAVHAQRGGYSSARIALQSLDFSEIRWMQVSDDWDGVRRVVVEAARRCELAGAESLVLCSNVVHKVAAEVQDAIDIPLLHIADAVADVAQLMGLRRLGVVGTRWVMEEDFYVSHLAARGIEAIRPRAEDRCEVDRVISDELSQGEVVGSARDVFADSIARLAGAGAEAVLVACTESPHLLGSATLPVPILDSLQLHAEAAVAFALDDALPALARQPGSRLAR